VPGWLSSAHLLALDVRAVHHIVRMCAYREQYRKFQLWAWLLSLTSNEGVCRHYRRCLTVHLLNACLVSCVDLCVHIVCMVAVLVRRLRSTVRSFTSVVLWMLSATAATVRTVNAADA
jgi:hypothetical protein